MGYYTSYTLSWDCGNSKTTWDEVSKEIKSRQNEGQILFHGEDGGGDNAEPCKWYEHEKDVAEFSKLYPDVLFELDGAGEDKGDIWRKYFLNGKVQVCEAKITYPKFNKSKLEEV